jgi:hypothetical protein
LLPELALSAGADLRATVDAIAAVQERDGCIPWFPGGKADPWNMVEAALALLAGSRAEAAAAAFDWLAARQLESGAWPTYYLAGNVVDATRDTNVSAYIAAGVWMHFLVTADVDALARRWPMVERAIEFAAGMQGHDGEIWWAADEAGRPWRRGLLAGSSSVHMSLGCALAAADELGCDKPRWRQARERLAEAVRHRPEAFEPKARWAMDWYYPVLGGVLLGRDGRARIEARWDDFVVEERGVRCVDDRPWITAAETCELVIALLRCGLDDAAAALFEWTHHLRGDDAAYWTGANFTDGTRFPLEQPTWTSAAVVLAGDALAGGPTATLFEIGG